MEKEVKSKECKFVVHRPATYDPVKQEMTDDVHFIKEKTTYTDGSTESKLKMVKNYKRPFWITLDHYQNYEDKHESELLERVREYKSTESDLWKSIATRLGGRYAGVKDKRILAKSPYVYGADINSKVFIKNEYLKKYPDAFTEYTVATLDIENDIDTGIITVISIARDGEVFTTILKDFIKGQNNPIPRLEKLFKENIPTDQKIKTTYMILENELDLFIEVMKVAHQWGTDFLAIWNMDYEITMFQDLCKRHHVRIEDYTSDPEVPIEYRFFNYKKSPEFKVSASGVRKATDAKDRWNVVSTPSKFYWIDAMSTYNYVRVNTKLVPTGYGLDSILGYELGDKYKKLKFKHLNDNNLVDADWHRFMSSKHPLEYIVYNQWDVLSMIELDKYTTDLSLSISLLSGISPFDIFDSSPKKVVNDLLFLYLEHGRVIGGKAPTDHTQPVVVRDYDPDIDGEELDDDDDEILGLGGWIVTLPGRRHVEEEGVQILKENPYLFTNVRLFVSDADQTSGYPNNGLQLNVSKDTTLCEVINIEGIEEDVFKRENINLMFGSVSSIQYCETMFKFPSIFEVDGYITKKLMEESKVIEAEEIKS